ncbi:MULTISPECIES: hypothetical protein [unclassified Streptosporangium]|uniref:hypothetical protein n=1 Tax=unclassified Streptosporangium TaxID=2632669 RepID=UPI002E2A8B6C|nr:MULTISPECIES: hypothetical protein [unclassified Streptosporangium]
MDELKTLIRELEHQPPDSLARQRLRLLEEATRKPLWTRFPLAGRAARGLARTPGLPGLSGRRLALGGAVAVMAVVASLVAPTLIGSAVPAYAVIKNPDGTITIEFRDRFYIKDFHKRLQEDLRAFGVPTVVDLLPTGKMCKEPRARYWPEKENRALTEWHSRPDVLSFTLHRDRIKSGQTLVVTFAGSFDTEGGWDFKVAEGPVATCLPVNDPRVVQSSIPESSVLGE